MNRRSGYTLVEILVASTIAVGLSVALARFSSVVSTSNEALRREGAMSSLQQEMTMVSVDLPGWFEILKSYSTYSDATHRLDRCLVPAGPSYANCPAACTVPLAGAASITITCGAASFADALLKAEAQGQRLSGLDLYDMGGQKFAGPPTTPVYLDAAGAPCTVNPTTNPKCIYASTGFMLINQTAFGTAPTVSFVRKIEQTAHTITRDMPAMAPSYERVVLGLFWRDPQGNGPDVGTVFAYSGRLTVAPGAPCSLTEASGFCIANGATVTVTTAANSTLPAHQKLCQAIRPAGPCGVGATFALPDLRGFFIRGGTGGAGTVPAWPTGSPQTTSTVANHTHQAFIMLSGGMSVNVAPVFGPVDGFLSGPGIAAQMAFQGNNASGYFGTRVLGPQIFPYSNFYPSVVTPGVGAALPQGTLTLTQVRPDVNVGAATYAPSTSTHATVSAGETRPSNAAVYYIIRDDYL